VDITEGQGIRNDYSEVDPNLNLCFRGDNPDDRRKCTRCKEAILPTRLLQSEQYLHCFGPQETADVFCSLAALVGITAMGHQQMQQEKFAL
jgi:hypothetical protein